MQPVIAPLFLTRPFEESLMLWSGNKTTYDDFFKQYWTSKLGGHDGYEKALQDGVVEHGCYDYRSVRPPDASFNASAVCCRCRRDFIHEKRRNAVSWCCTSRSVMGTGAQANNPWLLELPDPITRATWDNYAMVSPNFIKEQYGIDLSDHNQSDKFESHPDRQVIRLKANGVEMTMPVMAVPGMPDGVFAIALGYGRQSADPKNTGDLYRTCGGGCG